MDQAFLVYGVHARLRAPSQAIAMVQRLASSAGVGLGDVDLDLVGADPYLRDAFTHPQGIRRELRSVRHAATGGASLRAALRERAVASPRLRRLALGWDDVSSRGRRRASPGARGARTAAVFVANQRFFDLFRPVHAALEARGWTVHVFSYAPLRNAPPGAVAFADASADAVRGADIRPAPEWITRGDAGIAAVVSRAWLVTALRASWLTGQVQTNRHRAVLAAWRPDVVISFGPDTLSLALQAAAADLGIPSVFLPHGFLCALSSQTFVRATATAVPGWPCAEANAGNPFGQPPDRVVVTGHPNYDDIMRGGARASRTDVRTALGVPSDRPYLVVGFAEWGFRVLAMQAIQRRAFAMWARALPRDAFLVCKLHPSHEEREMCEAVLSEHLPRTAYRVVGDAELSTPSLLDVCDVGVGIEPSMVLSDLVLRGVPAIAIRHPENPFNYPAPFAWKDFEQVCRCVDDVDGLRDALVTLTRDSDARGRLTRHRRAYVERFLCAADARSSARVAELVEHLAAGKEPRTFTTSVGEAVTP